MTVNRWTCLAWRKQLTRPHTTPHHLRHTHALCLQAFLGTSGGGGGLGGEELNEDVDRITRWWIQVRACVCAGVLCDRWMGVCA